jgi:hypothetical protein
MIAYRMRMVPKHKLPTGNMSGYISILEVNSLKHMERKKLEAETSQCYSFGGMLLKVFIISHFSL